MIVPRYHPDSGQARSCSIQFFYATSATNTDICADFSAPPLSVTDKLTIPPIGFIIADFLRNCNLFGSFKHDAILL
ncbi:hypothetical protein [Streptococcus acidominimus]|nr:hypothetical protein [Streptococcus acidominimus]